MRRRIADAPRFEELLACHSRCWRHLWEECGIGLECPEETGTLRILHPEDRRYYLKRTSHGSTLSWMVHAWVLARTAGRPSTSRSDPFVLEVTSHRITAMPVTFAYRGHVRVMAPGETCRFRLIQPHPAADLPEPDRM